MSIRYFPFGFIFSEDPIALPKEIAIDFSAVSLDGRFHLSIRSELEYSVARIDEGIIVWLGTSYYVGPDTLPVGTDAWIAGSLIREGWDRFHEYLDHVAGRWAAIVVKDDDIRLYNDTFSLQPVYYSRNDIIVSSHLNLLRAGKTALGMENADLVPATQYYVWDETEDSTIGAVSPNFYYSYKNKRLTRFYPRGRNRFENHSAAVLARDAAQIARQSVKALNRLAPSLACALTGGLDSRVCAAAALAAGADPLYVTYGSVSEASPDDSRSRIAHKRDVRLASQIAGLLNLHHRVISVEEAQSYRLTAPQVQVLNTNNQGRHAREFQGLYEKVLGESPTFKIVGVGLETWQDHYASNRYPAEPRDEFMQVFPVVAGTSPRTAGGARNLDPRVAETSWSGMGYDSLAKDGHSPANFLMWEIRAGRFQSEAINCQTTAFLPVNPIGVRSILERALSYPFSDRKARKFHFDLISELYSPLLGFTVNAEDREVEAPRKPVFEDTVPFIYSDNNRFNHRRVEQNMPDRIMLGKERLNRGSSIYFEGLFGKSHGSLRISYFTPYSIRRAAPNVEIFVNVDGVDRSVDYLGYRNDLVTVVIDSLQRGTRVQLGIRSKADNGESWARASLLQLVEWIETDQWESDDTTVKTTSTTAIVNNCE